MGYCPCSVPRFWEESECSKKTLYGIYFIIEKYKLIGSIDSRTFKKTCKYRFLPIIHKF